MNSNITQYHATIIGGGIVGKTAALALTQSGLKVALVAPDEWQTSTVDPSDGDKSKLLNGKSRVYAFSSSSQVLFERLRIWQAIPKNELGLVDSMEIFGDRNGYLQFSAFQAEVAQLAWIINSDAIETVLDKALAFQSGLTHFKNRVCNFEYQKNGVLLSLETGATLFTDLIIGADGAQSWVRQKANIASTSRDYSQSAIVANFTTEKPHGKVARQWFINNQCSRFDKGKNLSLSSHIKGNAEILALLPMANGQVSLVWSAEKEHAKQLYELPLEQLSQALAEQTNSGLGAFNCVTKPQIFPLEMRFVKSLIAQNIVLVGDAAHHIHPLAGQGINLGLRDVKILTEVLAAKESFKHYGDHTVLRRYERSRKEDIIKLTIVTDGLHRLFAIENPAIKWVRNFGMSTIARQAAVKRWLISQALN